MPDPRLIPAPCAQIPEPCYACLYCPAPDHASGLVALAQGFSPRYERRGNGVVVVDAGGLERLLGNARAIGEEMHREAAARGLAVHVALASTQTAAIVLAHAHAGLTVVEPGDQVVALAPLPITTLTPAAMPARERLSATGARHEHDALSAFKAWGIRTLGELAALPSADLSARLGPRSLEWQAIARGDDLRPLVPDAPEERFESSLDLEWPIDGFEPLSFVLTRLLEPLSVRLERCDRGAAVLHVQLDLVTDHTYTRSLQLPSPIRDVRTLRTLALLDLESHPPAAAIDRVAIVIDPTPGRVLQHTLFAHPLPTPEQLSTLLARLSAVMGQDRLGAPALVDSYRPGAFAMTPFRVPSERSVRLQADSPGPAKAGHDHRDAPATALRRCRRPVPARVAVSAEGPPVRVTTDRRGFAGGSVVKAAGPWRTSGEWWKSTHWDRDEWDVALSDGGMYRIFLDRAAGSWFVEAIVD
jgi:protein ImuB